MNSLRTLIAAWLNASQRSQFGVGINRSGQGGQSYGLGTVLYKTNKSFTFNIFQVYVGAKNVAVDSVKQELVFVGSEAGKLIAIRDIIRKVGLYAIVFSVILSTNKL